MRSRGAPSTRIASSSISRARCYRAALRTRCFPMPFPAVSRWSAPRQRASRACRSLCSQCCPAKDVRTAYFVPSRGSAVTTSSQRRRQGIRVIPTFRCRVDTSYIVALRESVWRGCRKGRAATSHLRVSLACFAMVCPKEPGSARHRWRWVRAATPPKLGRAMDRLPVMQRLCSATKIYPSRA